MKASTNSAWSAPKHIARTPRSLLGQILGIVAEIFLTLAVLSATYLSWQMWWTAVEAEKAQVETTSSVSWLTTKQGNSGTVSVAQPQSGEPQIETTNYVAGSLIGEIYIPRFGTNWHRTIVEGTDLAQLNLHGLGRYESSQYPGQVGNFAIAGHRNGYGQPLGDVDKLQVGDLIIIHTEHYWYVYEYTSYEIVTPEQSEVIAPVPNQPNATPTQRMITMTTCEPKYSAPIYRWISYGVLKYWAKSSDGVPAELTTQTSSGQAQFVVNETTSIAAQLPSLAFIVLGALLVYLLIFAAAAVVWRWVLLREIERGIRPEPDWSFYGWLYRLQPGPLLIRILLCACLAVAFIAAMFEWICPWAASHIQILQQMSNYVAI